jgi:dTDP-4-amino-4,6-dideoxygalactose transaminase
MTTSHDDWIAVYRPELPPARAVAAYLERCDAARFYSNRGPLVRELEALLAAAFGQGPESLRSAASGTAALEAAILAHAGPAGPERPLALVPAYTFAATALAAERCGYRVAFLDVDPGSWALDPAALRGHPRLAEAGVVLPVAPYGRMPDLAGFETFQTETGVPVVVDAAAATEALLDAPQLVSPTLPLVLSFHATKTFATGEGGAVVWADPEGQARVEQVSNFGFRYSRECKMAGLNGKLSEYHAAVGLAMLDMFDARRRDYARVSGAWAAAARGLPGRLHAPPDLASVYILWEAPEAAAMDRAEAALTAAGIETRRWYEAGLHRQPHWQPPDAGSEAPALPVTEDLGARLLGLPMSHDLAPAAIARICGVLASLPAAAG